MPRKLRYNIEQGIYAAQEYFQVHGKKISYNAVVEDFPLGKWYRKIQEFLKEGALSDDEVLELRNSGINFGLQLFYQEDWLQISEKWLSLKGTLMEEDLYESVYRIGKWYMRYKRGMALDRAWFKDLQKFEEIWNTEDLGYEVPIIAGMSPWRWALEQVCKKDIPLWRKKELDRLDYIWSPGEVETVLKNRIKSKQDMFLYNSLQKLIEEKSMDGVMCIEMHGYVPAGKHDNLTDGQGYYRCMVFLSTQFTVEQARQYVSIMKNDIYHAAKREFLKQRTVDGRIRNSKDVRLACAILNTKNRTLKILFRVQQDENDFEKISEK